MSSIKLKKTFLRTTRLAYGIQAFEEGNYGTIALRISDRVAADGIGHRYAYLLTGVHNKSGRFPGVKEWHLAIRGIEGSIWLNKKGSYKIPILNKERASTINNVLAPILKTSIRSYAEYAKEVRQRQYEYRNAPELLAGIDDLFGDDVGNREKVTYIRDRVKSKLLGSNALVRLAQRISKQHFSESDELDDAIFHALASDESIDTLGFDADQAIAGIKTILLGSGHLWEELRSQHEAA